MIPQFNFVQPGKIEFGAGKFGLLANIINRFGRNALIVTGKGFVGRCRGWEEFTESLKRNKTRYYLLAAAGEPSPEFVDEAAAEFREKNINIVAAIGGGSAIDAGKAISAMIPQDRPAADFLEDVGAGIKHNGIKVPFIAVPTTAGTGSEATKNAVLSRVGPSGFKKSIRHDNLIPDVALVDPALALTCGEPLTAACGLDAFTQLLESYVSTKAGPMTDALAFSGMQLSQRNLLAACSTLAGDTESRTALAYAALMSGITLANAGLGVVHGLAGPIGGFFNIPHGVACGTLVAPANRVTIEKLLEERGPDDPALLKYEKVGELFSGSDCHGVATNCKILIEKLYEWTDDLKIPKLGEFGVTETDLDRIAAAADSKNNPIPLSPDEIKAILRERL
jgi:alcohol dehydrogenase class IV